MTLTRTLGAAAICLLLGAAGVLGRSQAPALRIVSPEPGSFVSGSAVIVAVIDPPSAPAKVSVFADGRLVCALEGPPYECPWDAGPGVNEHQVRVVAVLGDRTRLVQTVRTRGVAYAEAVGVDAIQVTVTVTDQSDRFVTGLARDAFRVWEDDVPQPITHFAALDLPLDLTAAIDVSGSMGLAMGELKAAVKRFLAALRPTHRVTLLAFNDTVFALARASVDPPARLRAVDRLAAWGGTALYDVLVRAVEGLGRQVGRRTLVTFSDGEDTASHLSLEAAERRLQMSDATIYTIAQGRAVGLASFRDILDRLARTSGGRAFASEDAAGLDRAFGAIVEELSNQYLLAYTPSTTHRDGAWHRIRVEAGGGRYKVRAREGYRAPSNRE